MPDLDNRIPGRMVLAFALHPITAPAACTRCNGAEAAVAQLMEFAPPEFMGDVGSPIAIAELFERFVAEQARGIFRMGDFEAIGINCFATRIARHQERADVATIVAALVGLELPERFVGTWAVAPGVMGRLYPMVVGLPGPLSIAQMYRLINQPLGTLDAEADVIPDLEAGGGQ